MNDISHNIDSYDFMIDEIEPSSVETLPEEKSDSIQQIEQYYTQIFNLSKSAENIVVKDIESSQIALNINADAKEISKSIEERRKKAVDPHRKIIQTINDYAKSFQYTLGMIDGMIKIKLAGWQKSQEIETQKMQEVFEGLSESLGINMAIMAPKASKSLSSAKASTYTKEKISFEIEDANLIPDEYWIIDEKAIQRHINLGKIDIPGIKIVTEKKLIVRKK